MTAIGILSNSGLDDNKSTRYCFSSNRGVSDPMKKIKPKNGI